MNIVQKIKRSSIEVLRGRSNSAAAIQSLLTKFLVMGLNACTSLIVARVLRPEGRGEMSALIVWSGFLSGLLTLGLPSSLIFNLRNRPERRSSMIGAAFVLISVLSLLVAIAGYFFLPFWLTKYSESDITAARWFLLSSPLPLFLLIGRAAMEATGKFSQSNFALWSAPLVTLTLLALLMLAHELTPVTGGLAYVLGSVPAMFWLTFHVWCLFMPDLHSFSGALKQLLPYGVRCWGVDLLGALGNQADQVLIVRFLTPESMGTYVVAASFARLLSVFQSTAVMVLFPRVAGQNRFEVVALTGVTARISTACAAICSIAISFAGPSLLGLLYGRAYVAEGTVVFRILLMEVVLGGATQILAQAFMASGRPGVVTAIQGGGVTIGVALMPILILKFGVAGAAAAMLISSVIRLTLTLLCFSRVLKTSSPRLVPMRSDVTFLTARLARLFPKTELLTIS